VIDNHFADKVAFFKAICAALTETLARRPPQTGFRHRPDAAATFPKI
jgi:hypothetical protein